MAHARLTAIGLSLVFSAGSAHADGDPLDAISCHAPTGKVTATFQPESSIRDLATWLAGITCKNVVLGAGVLRADARVTILAPAAMTAKQAVQLWVDAVEAAGFVVTQRPDTFIVKLGPGMALACADRPVAPPLLLPSPFADAVGDPADELAAAIDGSLHWIDDTHLGLSRALIDRLLSDGSALARSARLVPQFTEGKPTGWKLYAIRPSSIAARLGLVNGDTLVRVNGVPVTSVDDVRRACAAPARTIALELLRRGAPLTLTIVVGG
jgi:membrane-associated protease RseP (regulator of RpoE activity)